MRANGSISKIETLGTQDGHVACTNITVSLDSVIGSARGDRVSVSTDDEQEKEAKVAARSRARLIQATTSEYRGPYYRCGDCSWTWDRGAPEKHSGDCVLAPYGVAPEHTYRSISGEPGHVEPVGESANG